MATISRDELPPVIQGPSAWYGPDLAVRGDWIEHLSETEIAEIERRRSGWQTLRSTFRPSANRTFHCRRWGRDCGGSWRKS